MKFYKSEVVRRTRSNVKIANDQTVHEFDYRLFWLDCVLLSDVRLHEDNDVDHERRQRHGEHGPSGDGFEAGVERHEPTARRGGAEAGRHAQRLRPHGDGARHAHHQYYRDRHAEVTESTTSLEHTTWSTTLTEANHTFLRLLNLFL